MPKGQCSSTSIAVTKSAYNSYVSKTHYHYALSRGIKGGLAGTVFKNYKIKFGSFPDGLILHFDAWKRRHQYSIIYAEPVVITDEPVVITDEPIIVSFPEPVYSYWGF